MPALTCPHCGVVTTLETVTIDNRQAIMADKMNEQAVYYVHALIPAITDYDAHNWRYAIAVCQGCQEWFVCRENEYRKGWIPIYPISLPKSIPEEIPQIIQADLKEAYLCFSVEAFKGSVAKCAVALEHVWRDQKASGLKDLLTGDVITKRLFEQANEVRLWANIVKHDPILEPVSKEDAEQLLGYIDVILQHVYVEPIRLANLVRKRQEKENEAKKAKPGS